MLFPKPSLPNRNAKQLRYPSMKIIIGLGNPGKEYEKTRHNAGFLCVDFLRETLGFEKFKPEKRMSALTSSGMLNKEKVLIIKPETFMNNSGTSVRAILDYYKLTPADIAILHDDLDIAPGVFKTTLSSRAAGHNGVQDIINKLGTQDFFRIRLGIGKPIDTLGACMPIHDYVLQRFSTHELEVLSELFPEVADTIHTWIIGR